MQMQDNSLWLKAVAGAYRRFRLCTEQWNAPTSNVITSAFALYSPPQAKLSGLKGPKYGVFLHF